MTEELDRKAWDEKVEKAHVTEKVAADLGLKGEGKHFFCPGCQPEAEGRPELVIKEGHFKCFRCDAQGDVVGLVKLARKCNLEEAIVWLAKETPPET